MRDIVHIDSGDDEPENNKIDLLAAITAFISGIAVGYSLAALFPL